MSEVRPPASPKLSEARRATRSIKMPTVYVLQSIRDGKTYLGSTDNFEKRLLQHESGRVISTKHRRPFRVLFTEEFDTLKKARKRELWYKSGAGRRKLKEYFNNH